MQMEIKISDELNTIIGYAREEALRTGSYGIGPDHLFLGIIRHADNDACRTLTGLGADTDSMKSSLTAAYSPMSRFLILKWRTSRSQGHRRTY